MSKLHVLLLCCVALPARAVDGAGLRLAEVVGFGAVLFGAALPALLIAALLFLVIRGFSKRKRGEMATLEGTNAEPPASVLTGDEIETMNRWSIFFNGTSFRRGDHLYESLAEAVAAAQKGEQCK
jgi:hypothetical protein